MDKRVYLPIIDVLYDELKITANQFYLFKTINSHSISFSERQPLDVEHNLTYDNNTKDSRGKVVIKFLSTKGKSDITLYAEGYFIITHGKLIENEVCNRLVKYVTKYVNIYLDENDSHGLKDLFSAFD